MERPDTLRPILVRQFAIDKAMQIHDPSIDTDPEEIVDFAATIARFILNGEQAPADDVGEPDVVDPAPEAPSPSVSAVATHPAPVSLPMAGAETTEPAAPDIADAEPAPALTETSTPAPAEPVANDPVVQAPNAPVPATPEVSSAPASDPQAQPTV